MKTEKQELLEKKKLFTIVKNWAIKNKTAFWKYEISCYHETFKISVINLPGPTEKDVSVTPNNKSLNNKQKLQLCNAIADSCAKAESFNFTSIDVKIDYEDGSIIAECM